MTLNTSKQSEVEEVERKGHYALAGFIVLLGREF